jgi:hypothetical protein
VLDVVQAQSDLEIDEVIVEREWLGPGKRHHDRGRIDGDNPARARHRKLAAERVSKNRRLQTPLVCNGLYFGIVRLGRLVRQLRHPGHGACVAEREGGVGSEPGKRRGRVFVSVNLGQKAHVKTPSPLAARPFRLILSHFLRKTGAHPASSAGQAFSGKCSGAIYLS